MRLSVLSLAVLAAAAVPVLAPTASSAATSSGCDGGAYVVTLPGGATVSGSASAKVALAGLPATARLHVQGRYTAFDVAPVTGDVFDYVYTGAANPQSMTLVRTPVFDSKVLSLGPVLHDQLEVRTDGGDLLLLSRGRTAKVKVQAKDCATGGIFQQEVEAGAPVTVTHTLAANQFYFVNPATGKVNFGDGTRFRGKDSPQVATKLSQGERVTVWQVASGGRMGGVLGEDAVELSAGASACVQDCQAQNRVHGSLPVTDPAFSG